LGQLPVPGILLPVAATNTAASLEQFQMKLDLAREQRRDKSLALASQTLVAILQSNAPPELMRLALFELALVAQDGNQFVKAQQIFAQYLHVYESDPSVPEVLLRQGMIYRQMGVNTLAVSKFYAVMSSALKLKLDNLDYYKKLVLQAQIEIADTYYLEGNYASSADFFNRLLKSGGPELDRSQIQFKLIRSLSFLTNNDDTIARAQVFLNLYTNSSEIPEVRFLLASSLKKLGRNSEAMKQVLLLLQSQQENVGKNPETWIYWQQRAGNEIANQLYKEGDYLNALQIYLSLADLNHSPAWQMPVWYQTGLVYEQLQQWQKATDTYLQIMGCQKELADGAATPSLQSLIDMAKWRKDYIDWFQKAKLVNQSYQTTLNTNPTNNPTTAASP
jgi:tetratricopeptide (TPR) repeat protein